MEKTPTSKQKFYYFGAVINAKENSLFIIEDLRGYEAQLQDSLEFSFIATIIHDQDKDIEGKAKLSHLHAFFRVAEPLTHRQALTTLRAVLQCEETQISVDGSNNDILLCQYLTHQNHPEKAQYSAELVKTNNREKLSDILAKKYEPPKNEQEEALEAVFSCITIADLAKEIGLDKANKYRGFFNQVKQEQRQDYESLKHKKEILEADFVSVFKTLKKFVNLADRKIWPLPRDIEEAKEIVEVYGTLYDEIIKPHS